MNKSHIILIDDEVAIAETVISYCLQNSIHCKHFTNGEEAIEYVKNNTVDLAIIDWMLPGISGPEIVKKFREMSEMPIIMMSARDDESDIVIGLEIGADDYVTKPFGPRELMARIKVLLRRGLKNIIEKDLHTYGDLQISFSNHEITKNGEKINLTRTEFSLFKALLENKGTALKREYLMEKVLGYRDFLYDRTLDTHMKNIRLKIEEDPKKPQYITTVRGVGFKLTEIVNSK